MLTEFSLSNFKSYKNSRLPLAPLTVLIGANASGKSNIIEGLRFLSWLAEGQKLSSIQYAVNSTNSDQVIRGLINNLCHYGESDFNFGCRLNSTEWDQLTITIQIINGEMKINAEKVVKSTEKLVLYEYVPVQLTTSERDLVDLKDLIGVTLNQKQNLSVICSDQMAIFSQLDNPILIDGRYSDYINDTVKKIARKYQQALQNILFSNPTPAKMRDYSQKSDYKELIESGSNLSSVLFHLWKNQPENKLIILNFIQSLPEQAIDGLDFLHGPRDEVMVRLSETFGNTKRYCEAALLSDGTLRVLAIAAAMLSATAGSLVVIEEIDNGVHPSRAKHLLANIRDIAEKRKLRVLLSTHNPALMDALPDEALGDVVFCYRDPEQGDSRLVRLGDMDEFPGLIAQGSLGDLVTTGIVDRFVKHPQTPEDRKRKALEWLAHLQEYRNE
jgi:predicted ATPase